MNLFVRTAVVLGVGAVLGLLGNAVHPAGVPLSQPVWALAEVGQCSATAEAGAPLAAPSLPTPDEISPEQATALRGTHDTLFGDLRPPDEYAHGHIPGAVHLPCSGPLGKLALAGVPSGAALIVYDQDGHSSQLLGAAQSAANRGISKVYLLRGGFAAWIFAGLPTEAGICERCGAP